MNTSLLRMRKAIASFTIGTLLASFLAVPAAFAAGTPEWAMEGANAYLKAETRDQGYVLANKCEVATMIANALDLPMGDTEAQRGAEFQDLQGGMAWCQAAAGAVANTGIATGNGDMFGAAGSVSRAVVATMLVRAFQLDAAYQPAALSAERQAEFAGLEWAQEPMALGVAAGIINGDAEGRLLPMEGASKWAVATMLYRAANMGAEEATEEATEEAEATPEVAPTGGALTVSVSSSTPSSAKLPKGAEGIAVASYDFTAGSDAVTVTGLVLTRGGLSNDGTLTGVTLVDSNGVRLSKTKTFSTDTDDARVNFMNGGLTIPARSTVEVTVVAGLGTTTGEEFNLQVLGADDVSSNSSSVSGSFPLVSEDMEVAPVTAGELLVEKDTTPSNPDLGDKQALVSRFELIANTADRDVIFHGITFEEIGTIDADEIQNFTLEIEGEVVATTATLVNDYLAFTLDTPMVLEESETYDAEILADIVSGPGKTISFKLDSDLDVRAEDADYGYGVAVNAAGADGFNGAANANVVSITVQAGELTVVATDAPELEILDDQDNIVLGSFEIFPVHGQDIELKQFETQISLTAGTANLDVNDILENVELRSNFGTFSLDGIGADGGVNNDSDTVTLVDDSVDVMLPSTGTFKADIVADIKDVANNSHFAAAKLEVRISSIGKSSQTGAGLYFEEQEEDTAITDVTPSSIVFSEIEGKQASLTSSSLTLSSSFNSVHGTEGVVMHKVDVAAGSASSAFVNKMVFNKVSLDDNIGRGDNVLMTLTAVGDNTDDATLTVDDGVTTDTCTLRQAEINAANAAAVVAEINSQCSLFSATLHTAGGAGVGKFYVSYLGNLLDANNEIADSSGADTFDLTQDAFVADTNIDNTRVNVAKLYVDDVAEGNLVQEVNASDFTNSEIIFDDFNGSQSVDGRVEIASDDSREFYLVFDLISNEDNANDAMKVRLTSLEAEDSRGDDLNETANRDSDRTVTVRGAGTLTHVVDNTDDLVDSAKYIIAGTSEIVASYEFNVQNEPINIINADLVFTGVTTGDASDYYSTIEILDEEMNVIDSESVRGNTVSFTDISGASGYTLEEGSTNVYIRLTASAFGKDQAGSNGGTADHDHALTFEVQKMKGVKEITPPTAATSASNQFGSVPVNVTDIKMTNTGVATSLSNGDNIVAQLTVDTAAHSNTDLAGDPLTTDLQVLTLQQDKTAATTVGYYQIERDGKATTALNHINVLPGEALDITMIDNAANTIVLDCLADGGTSFSNFSNESAQTNDNDPTNEADDLFAKINADCDAKSVVASRDGNAVVLTAGVYGVRFISQANGTLTNSNTLDLDRVGFAMNFFGDDAATLDSGQSASYNITAKSVSLNDGDATNEFIQLKLPNLTTTAHNLSFRSSESTDSTTTLVRFANKVKVDGPKVNEF